MASISNFPQLSPTSKPTSHLQFSHSTFPLFSISTTPKLPPSHCALKTGSSGDKVGRQEAYVPDLLRKPVVTPVEELREERTRSGGFEKLSASTDEDGEEPDEEEWDDWENRILEDTVPLVGFVRMILHSGKYESGDKLNPEHEKTIIERLLPYHPEFEKKVGCGIDHITIGYHPDFEKSRCLFIVRKDGELVDFSYWKCLKGLIRKNYPRYADSFILRHFRQRRRSN
ncbi:hypothetical protein Syun_004235 [Stephania yunnanensis]|uniref:Uncharacterized protein n=1 Tax=Stephania yunnanensis TaxID=152371 RepID=A0AAP0L2N2_9MAGN